MTRGRPKQTRNFDEEINDLKENQILDRVYLPSKRELRERLQTTEPAEDSIILTAIQKNQELLKAQNNLILEITQRLRPILRPISDEKSLGYKDLEKVNNTISPLAQDLQAIEDLIRDNTELLQEIKNNLEI